MRAISRGDAEETRSLFARQHVVIDPARVSDEMLMETMLATQGWYLEDDTVELTPELTNAIAAFATDLRGPVYRIFKGQDLPAAHLVQRRVEIQVLSILGQLRPRLNFHRVAREWVYREPPLTALGAADRAWREPLRVAV
jgi:hypothetical protein